MNIVFCPYLSAMWSSMKPLYEEHLAAGDDVRVMPLPYCVKYHDGSRSDFAVDEYPVPVTEPSSTFLEEWHPDRIYFHNPYDDHNFITMVDPRFFTKQLASFTSDLVFVPYYTRGFTDGGDIETVIRSEGVRRANHIIVWSEAQKARYASILCKYSVDWMDRIIIKERPSYQFKLMPEEWLLISQGRRLVMLGTSLCSLFGQRRSALDQIAATIRRNQNDDICLVFRPHPLYIDTIKAMMPELEHPYRTILDNFINLEQGILDETPDVEESAYFCTEYIGNPSSIVAIFREQGKPITII